MSHYFSRVTSGGGMGCAALQTIFDAEQGTPGLIDAVAATVPQIRHVMASLRESLPLVPHAGVGPIGRSGFFRIPNHSGASVLYCPPIQGLAARARE